jgi:hypothetical protein
MLKSHKSHLTCSYCSRIVKGPIALPCDETICREHLSERDVVKQNKIKCKKCSEEFQVNGLEFKSNIELMKLLESHSYLSSEELKLKRELEDSIQKFFEFYDEFSQKRTKLDLDVYNHYQELRFQINQHREELKEKSDEIDEIALAMIDQTKKYEALYLRNIKEGFSLFDDCKSLEHVLNQIEETFRNPNLLIQSIKEMQQKQETALNAIQSKLNEITLVKDTLIATNYFQPTFSPINQEGETSTLFGLIKLNACWLNVNSFKGHILTSVQQYFILIKLCEFSPSDKWSLLYRGTRDGFGAKDFHSKCDGHSNTLTIVKAKESGFIFGGYTTVTWESSAGFKFKSDPNAFIFSLTNKDNKPVKMNIDPDPNRHGFAIYCRSSCGPSFGGGVDICIANNANTTMNSVSYLGSSYKHPQYAYDTDEAKSFLAGSHMFKLDEIEVYEKRE